MYLPCITCFFTTSSAFFYAAAKSSSILVFPEIKSPTFDANANSASGHQGSEGQ